MRLEQPSAGCSIEVHAAHIRASVASRSSGDIRECYRAIATLALEHRIGRVLVIGVSVHDAHSHLAARDAVIAIHELGAPQGFRIGFVPQSDATRNGYRHAETEAIARGMRARMFPDEAAALAWLLAPDVH